MQNERKIVELPIEDVLPNRFQPRIKFNEDSINELSVSIKKYGVIQPIVVRQIGTKYEIIAGERRYKASVLAGKTTIPAIIVELSDKDSVEIALIENVQREDLTAIEKAISYKKILDMGYIKQEELAEKIGKSQSAIANTLRLLNLSDEAQEALLENKISERHARSLLKLKDNDKQVKMLNRIINERLTVRKTDEEIDKMINETNNNDNIINSSSSTISQPIESNDSVINIPDTVLDDQINSNLPGFMNIDQIEKQATDINVEPPKPAINMDQLMTSTGINPPKNDENDLSVPNMQSNKFFNFFDEPSNEENNNSSSSNFEMPSFEVPSVPTIETPSFEVPSAPTVETPSFEVPSAPTVETPSFEMPSAPTIETPSFEVPSAPTIETPNFEVPSASTIETPSFEVPSTPTIETPSFEVPSTPTIETPSFEVPSVPTIETPSFEVPSVPTVETPSFEMPSVPTIETPSFEMPSVPTVETPSFEMPSTPTIETPSFEVPSAPTIETPSFEVPSTPIVETPSFEVPSVPTIETPSFEMPSAPTIEIPSFEVPSTPTIETPSFEVPSTPTIETPSFEVPEEVVIPTIDVEPIIDVDNTQNANIQNDFVTSPSIQKPDIKSALNAVRECESQLEKLGFVVDAEETDFENVYEITFKIQK